MDRHADFQSARNDGETAVLKKWIPNQHAGGKETSLRLFSKEAALCDDFASFQGVGAGIYLSGNEQARVAESSKSAQKPTLKPQPKDSRNCGGAVGALRDFEGRSYLSGNDYSQNHAINPHCSPKTESLQNGAVFFYHKDRIIPPLRLP